MEGQRPRRAAVLGQPVGHSRSPALHTAAYAALGLTGWTYDAVECGADALAPFLAGCDDSWAGLSLTMPLKRRALQLASAAGEPAVAAGAANTLVPAAGGWRAENTDVTGIRTALAGAPVEHPVLLGAGGTAQAAVVALQAMAAGPVTVLVRDPARAVELHAAADRVGQPVRILRWSDRLPPADVVVSTVPAGAADALAGTTSWGSTAVLLDVLYAPWPTALAAAASRAGVRVVSGAEVLLHQAAAQVTLMTGRPAPLPAMRAALA